MCKSPFLVTRGSREVARFRGWFERLRGEALVRLPARDGAREHASAWTYAQPGAVLARGSVEHEGVRVILLEGATGALAIELPR